MGGPHTKPVEPQHEPLTRREREALSLLAEGLTAPEMAAKLTIAVSSVKYHIQHVYGKLGVNNRRQAVARARELGLLPAAAPASLPATAPDTLPHTRHNLPQPLTRLIGREREIGAISQLLVNGQQAPARLVTLVGPGGAGKTRLSLALAGELLTAYGDGVWLVELAPLSDRELLFYTVAASLGLRREVGSADPGTEAAHRPLAALIEYLQTKHCLLVLDNCEHLVEACARLAEALLRACPRLQVLATSREALGVTGEVVWSLAGLTTPPAALTAVGSLEPTVTYAAVQLFVERARAARPGFSVTPQNAASVAQVCRQLDGLPLAIELAAARVALLPAEQIAALLAAHDRFRLLTGGGRTAMPRHQTLQATIDWSYQLLSEKERTLLRRLTVFAGGWTLAAAEAVCAEAAGEPLTVLETLSRLAAKSLVNSEPTESGEARFQMLETIREYSLDKLEGSGEAAVVRRRHLAYFVDLAERAEPEMRGPDQLAWYDRIEVEHDNLRRALEWAVHSRATAAGLRLASALHRFWDVRGNLTEAHTWVSRLLGDNPTPQPSAAWAMALARAAYFASRAGDWTASEALCVAGLAMSRQLGAEGVSSAAHALSGLAWVGHWQHSHDTAALQRESLALFEQAGDDWGRAALLETIGFVNKTGGDYPSSRDAFEESLALFEQLGDLAGSVRVFNQLGHLATWHGEYQEACRLHKAAADHGRRLRDWGQKAMALVNLAEALNCLGQFDQAEAALDECIALLRRLGHLQVIPIYRGTQAEIAVFRGQYDRAEALIEESRKAAAEISNVERDLGVALTLGLASIARARGGPAQSVSMLNNVLPVFQEHQHYWWTAFAQRGLGEALRDLGAYEQATALLKTSLAFFRARGKWLEVTVGLLLLGGVARRQGNQQRATALLGETLRRCQATELRQRLAPCLAEIAYLFAAKAEASGKRVQAEHAARLLGAYESLSRAMNVPIPPVDHSDRAEYDRATTALRTRLGPDRLDALWAEGGAMTTAAAASYALAELDKGHL